ncbi:MAG: NYN domain-containing protein [Sphaerochaetaceae bacterium]|nr:NYN domain-containing protein [Sphaerochaetaceae bacterium]
MNCFSISMDFIQVVVGLATLIMVIVGYKSVAKPSPKRDLKCRRFVLQDIPENLQGKDFRRTALLIDADNINSKFMKTIMNNISQMGDVAVVYKCLYGVSERQGGWNNTAKEYGVVQKYLTNYVKGKNTTDFSIVIDCMDLLGYDIDVFVLCSSDSDFSSIAKRIREDGKMVVGMGQERTPDVFRNSCNLFFQMEDRDVSLDDLKTVLEKLVAYYGNRPSYEKIKNLITQRFALSVMGFQSFDAVLKSLGYHVTKAGCITKQSEMKDSA